MLAEQIGQALLKCEVKRCEKLFVCVYFLVLDAQPLCLLLDKCRAAGGMMKTSVSTLLQMYRTFVMAKQIR